MAEKKELPNEYREEAEKLALLPYTVSLIKETDSAGNPVYLAFNRELDGCIANGNSFGEAIENLKEARIDYIQVLLLSGEPVPHPSVVIIEETSTVQVEVETVFNASEFYRKDKKEEVLGKKDEEMEYTFNWTYVNSQR